MLPIISTLSFVYIMLWFIYSTLIHISFNYSFIFSYLSLTTFLNHDKKALHFSSSPSSFFPHQEWQTSHQQWSSQWWSHQDTQQLQCSLRWQLCIQQRAPSEAILQRYGQAAIKTFSHVNTWKTYRDNSIYTYIGATPQSWASGGQHCFTGWGWRRACLAGIWEGIQLRVWVIQSAHYIRKMYFSHWNPPGVSERMWSVNLDAPISGEYQTLGGHSCRPSE